MPFYAPFSLVRATADALVRCKHLLDPAVSETERLARGLNERLDNQREQLKAYQTPEAQQHYDQQVAPLEKQAIANGITPVRKTGASPILGFNEPVKRDIDLFTSYLPGAPDSRVYRFCRAMFTPNLGCRYKSFGLSRRLIPTSSTSLVT